jgi:hypothetical protein
LLNNRRPAQGIPTSTSESPPPPYSELQP